MKEHGVSNDKRAPWPPSSRQSIPQRPGEGPGPETLASVIAPHGNGNRPEAGFVLHVLPSAIGRGAQLYARALVDLLDEPDQPHRLMSIYEGDQGIHVDLSLGRPGGAAAAGGFDPRVALRLRRYCAERSPGVLVAHGGDPLKYLVAARPRVPIAYNAIGTVERSVHSRLRRELWRRLLARADVVAAVSEDVAEECRSLLNVPAGKVVVVPNGRDSEMFSPRPTSSGGSLAGAGDSDLPMLLFVGHLAPGKRPDVFVELVRALRAQGVSCKAAVVGDGPMRGALTEPARSAGVELLGERNDVAELMRGADLFVFPSLPEGEGMPGVLIEAGLSGLCVLATRVPGVSTVIDDRITGSVVDVSDFGSLVQEARRLLADPVVRSEMGRAAREKCVSDFSMQASARAWRDLLGRLSRR